MLPLKFATRWRIASILLLLLVLAATILPAVWLWPDRARLSHWLSHSDKWAHAITFLILALWFAGQYRRKAYWRIAVGLAAFGALIEIVQRMVGYRTAEWLDMGADMAGIAAGLTLALLGLGGWALRVENWFTAKRA